MRRASNLFKKIGGTKGTFHARMGTIKDRNIKDLIEAKEIKKRWQEYTEELYERVLNDLDNHDGVVIHLEPDILEWEVKRVLGSVTTNKVSGGDRIPAELFKILKDDAVKVLSQNVSRFGKLRMATGLEKISFHSVSKKGNAKECSYYHTIALISHASKVMFKIFQDSF